MKLLGAFLIFLACVGLQSEVTLSNIGLLLFGLFLVGIEWWIQMFGQRIRYIERDKR